jgi:hypothetical protein
MNKRGRNSDCHSFGFDTVHLIQCSKQCVEVQNPAGFIEEKNQDSERRSNWLSSPWNSHIPDRQNPSSFWCIGLVTNKRFVK